MKLRNLSILLFAAACGGGGTDNPMPIDSQPSDGGGFFPNSRNDVFLITFPEAGLTAELTPDTGDAPDNATAFNIGQTGGTGIAGEMGIAGDKSDDYFERDSYLLATGQNVNELTVRLDWDGGQADMDYVLFAEPAQGDTDFTVFGSGTLISDGVDAQGVPQGEFTTFTADPSANYILWAGVFNVLSAGGAPSLPKPYDLSVYGANITPASFAACDFTEAADNTNNSITRFGGNGTREATNITATGRKTFCGTLNPHTFVPDQADATVGTEEVDTFSVNVPLEGDYLLRVIGATDADQTKINTLIATGVLQAGVINDGCLLPGNGCPDADPNTAGNQPRPQQFFSLAAHTGTHGVDAFFARASTFENPQVAGDIQGPKAIAIFVRSPAAMAPVLTETINYKIELVEDPHNTRAPRKTGDQTEQNDN